MSDDQDHKISRRVVAALVVQGLTAGGAMVGDL
jgi:hypothetical protein